MSSSPDQTVHNKQSCSEQTIQETGSFIYIQLTVGHVIYHIVIQFVQNHRNGMSELSFIDTTID